ncbi:hypothetical protein DLE01_39810, partial [Streptomyces sp. FT05W]
RSALSRRAVPSDGTRTRGSETGPGNRSGAELARLWQQAGQEGPGVRSSAAGTTTGFSGGRS